MKTIISRLAIITAVAMGFSSCDESGQADADDQIIQQYLRDNNLTANLQDNGVYYIPLVTVANGKAVTQSSVVSVYYTLRLLEGTVLEEHQSVNGDPKHLLQFIDTTIPVGIYYGLTVMSVGETYQLIIPSTLAYSDLTGPGIPANAILICDVEVVDVVSPEERIEIESQEIEDYITAEGIGPFEKQESGLYYRKFQSGNGTSPDVGSDVQVAFTGYFLNGKQFDSSQSFTFTIDEGTVIEGFDEGVALMEFGETATIIIPSSLGWGASAFVIPEAISSVSIPPFSVVVFEITLFEQ